MIWFPLLFLPFECLCSLVVLCRELAKYSGIGSTMWKAVEIISLGSGKKHGKINNNTEFLVFFFLWQLITKCCLAIGYSLQSRLKLVHLWLWQVKLLSVDWKANHHYSLRISLKIFSSVNARGFFFLLSSLALTKKALILLSSYFILDLGEGGEMGYSVQFKCISVTLFSLDQECALEMNVSIVIFIVLWLTFQSILGISELNVIFRWY